jgi:hypothetical protein
MEENMKKKNLFVCAGTVLVLFALTMAGCGVSTKDLAKQVKEDIESNWAEMGITVDELTLVKRSNTEYRGVLKISANGESEAVTVNVTVDGDSFMWEIEEL